MTFRRRRLRSRLPSGFYRFQSVQQGCASGFGDSDFVRLRDQEGNIWMGLAEAQGDDTIRYRFRDSSGNVISGISDRYGILLRDDKGNTWRGYVY